MLSALRLAGFVVRTFFRVKLCVCACVCVCGFFSVCVCFFDLVCTSLWVCGCCRSPSPTVGQHVSIGLIKCSIGN